MLTTVILAMGSHNLEHQLQWVLNQMDIGTAGYFVLFGLLFSCGLGVPIPEDLPLLVAGALVGSGHMNLVGAGVLAWCGIIGGDCMLYFFGYKYGLNITKVPLIGKHVTKPRILKAEALFSNHGVWVVAVGRLFAGIRGAMVIAAGTIRFNFLKFVIVDGLAALVSGGLFIWLGYKFGQNLPTVAHAIHHFGGWILAGVITLVVAFIAWKIYSGHRENAEAIAFAHASAIARGDVLSVEAGEKSDVSSQ